MNFAIGSKLHGFTITNIREVENKNAQLIEMVYEKTNTELCWYKHNEINKLFCIGFKTLPKDDTGVFHILEHSVLAGSEKYPTKEPFVDLLKTSMNTFLNAITFSDKTIYPVSSRNEQDFLNLTSVYLDAVFAPLMRKNANIFYQEGWHYEKDGDTLIYNGVVFNEMKGASSSVQTLITDNLCKMVFKDNSYGFNSGGDPKAIPDLTYEGYVDTYNEFYHPTNSRIFLDGDLPIDKVLALIDSYLTNYTIGTKHEITPQLPVSLEKDMYYEVSGDTKDKAYLSLAKIIGNYDEKVKVLATHVLADVLAGNNDAPLTRAILTSKLGQDVRMNVYDGVAQPWFAIRVDNINNDDANAIKDIIKNCVQDLVNNGIDKKELRASINAFSYQLKETREPQGLERGISAYDAWLYNGDPMTFLNFDEAIKQLNEMAESNAFETLLEELVLYEEGLCTLHTLPSLTYGEETRAQEKARLAKEKAEMSEATLNDVIAKAEALAKWQNTPNSKEASDTIPILDIKEVDEKIDWVETVETNNGVKVLHHPVDTNGIVHTSMYFSLRDYTKEELTKIAFLCSLMGELPTKNYDSIALQREIKTYIGALSFKVEAYADATQCSDCTPYLCANFSVLEENFDKAQALIVDILTNTIFEKERVLEVVQQAEMMAKQYIVSGGRNIASYVTMSHYATIGVVNEVTHGFTYLKWVCDFAKAFEEMYEDFLLNTQKVMASLGKKRMHISITCNDLANKANFVETFKEGTCVENKPEYTTNLPKKMGIKIPAQASYAVSAHHLQKQNRTYHGSLRLFAHIATFSYLWEQVRVQGGAYGVGMSVGRSGNFSTHSYRDPSPARSLDVYRNLSAFVHELVKEDDLTKYIISTIATTEPLLTSGQKGKTADSYYLSNITKEDILKERMEILHSTKEDLLSWCDVLDVHAKEAAVCVVGFADALKACEKENLEIYEL